MYSHVVPIPGKSESDDAPLFDDSKDACRDIDTESDDEEIVKVR